MKKKLSKEIEIPEGLEISLEGDKLKVKGPEGENAREFDFGKVKFEKKDGKIILSSEKATKREKKTMNTLSAHINNIINGVQKKFEYKLKICSSHFPMTVSLEGNEAVIKNFLGEKVARRIKMPEGVKIDVGKDTITITSIDKETAGQAAANFENVTKIRDRDKRVFQDGIYIINKCGRVV